MPEYINVSNTHLQIAEHRFVEPNGKVVLTEDQAEPLIKGGWLIPIISSIAEQIIDGEISNFVNNIDHTPANPINVNINTSVPVGISDPVPTNTAIVDTTTTLVSSSVSSKKKKEDPQYIKEALERAKVQREQKKSKEKAPGVLDQNDVFDSDEFKIGDEE